MNLLKNLSIYKLFLFTLLSIALNAFANEKNDRVVENNALPLRIVLLGAPGSGKGTQADLLSKKYHIPNISPGDILRKYSASGTDEGKRIIELMKVGDLVHLLPIVNKLTIERLEKPDCKNGFILDGFPRQLKSVKVLESYLAKAPKGDFYVINLKLDENDVLNRIKKRAFCAECNVNTKDSSSKKECNVCRGDEVARADDNPETVKLRLENYRKETLDVIRYYESKPEYSVINANQSVDEVFKNIEKVITKK